jgi:DNA-binding transcriptional LysR family regulator
MPDVLASFMADRPNISVALQTRSSARIVEWVAARQVDMGVCFYGGQHPGVVAEPLVSLQLYCAIPPGDPLEKFDTIRVEQLAGRDLIIYDNLDHTRFWLEALLEQQKVYARRRVQVFWTSVAMELVMRGVGIALVDRLTAARIPGGLDQLRPLEPGASFDLSLVWPEHWPSSVIALSFADALREHLRDHAT